MSGFIVRAATPNAAAKRHRHPAMAAARHSTGGLPKRRCIPRQRHPASRCGLRTCPRPAPLWSLRQPGRRCRFAAGRDDAIPSAHSRLLGGFCRVGAERAVAGGHRVAPDGGQHRQREPLQRDTPRPAPWQSLARAAGASLRPLCGPSRGTTPAVARECSRSQNGGRELSADPTCVGVRPLSPRPNSGASAADRILSYS
jgi:hypothetical protein